ncbi:MAG: Gfo/Idh/MocA family oxidoreductase [Spirochaetaceae bacterium]|jgi:predicted dehydrogenase|nr:Gfo/Idh/MocA family oxidoreductase [Spirochaetaceae bacterium]
MVNEVCWGMIGCGNVTEKKSGPPLYKTARSRVKGVYSRNGEHSADYAGRHGIPLVYPSADALFADGEINAAYISTPPDTHRKYALLALAAGKIPYIEKPMAMNYGECTEILAAGEAAKLPVYVAYYRRALPKYLKIKELVDSGRLGAIRAVRLTHFMKPEAADRDRSQLPWRVIPAVSSGGKFVDMAVHVLDIVQFLFGDIVSAQGFADNRGGYYDAEDTVGAVMLCESGVRVSGLWCYAAGVDDEEMLILGEKGCIRTSGLFLTPVHVTDDCGEETFSFPEPEHVAGPFVQTLVEEMTGGQKSNACVKSAANNVRVVDTILAEYRKRGAARGG